MSKNFRKLIIKLFLILTCTFFTACPALADSIASNTVGPRISRYTNFNLSNPDNIFTYDFWPGAVSPSNVWWIPLEFNTQEDDAIQAIIKPITYPDGWQGYEMTIGTERQKITNSQFDLAQAVGRLSYKPKDRSNGYCTATHVGNGYVVTAGHCLDNPKVYPDTCSALRVEWNYRRSRADFSETPESDLIGQCQEIISWSFAVGDPDIIDHAIFRVDRFPAAKIVIEPKPALKVGDRLHQFSHPGAAPLTRIFHHN